MEDLEKNAFISVWWTLTWIIKVAFLIMAKSSQLPATQWPGYKHAQWIKKKSSCYNKTQNKITLTVQAFSIINPQGGK